MPPVFTKFDSFQRTIKNIGWMLLIVVFTQIGIDIIKMVLMRYWDNSVILEGLALIAKTLLPAVCALVYAKKQIDVHWFSSDLTFDFPLSAYLKTVAVMFSCAMILSLVMMLFQTVLGIRFYNDALFQYSDPVYRICVVIAGVIFAPVLEEMLCRGVILRSLKDYNALFSIVMTGLLFGMLHMNLVQAIVHCCTGMILAYVSLKYKSLILTILVHMTHNALSFLTVFSANNVVMSAFVGLLMYVLIIAGIVVIAMEWKNWARFLRSHSIHYPYFQMAFKQVSVILFGIVFVILSALVMIV